MKTVKLTLKLEHAGLEIEESLEVNAAILEYKHERKQFISLHVPKLVDKLQKQLLDHLKEKENGN